MVINRVKHLVADQRDVPTYEHFYTVETPADCYWVSFETVLMIEYQLDRAQRPAWIEFHDLFGARQRVLSQMVVRISESTPASRAAARAFSRARKSEADWDGDSCTA